MSGTIHLYRDGRMWVETDETPPPMETIAAMKRTIEDRGVLVLGKGWNLVHEGSSFGVQMPPPDPGKPSEGLTSPFSVVVFGLLAGLGFGFAFGVILGAAAA